MSEQRPVEDTGLSIQDQLFPELPCFGCGPNNPKGLHLRSYLLEGEVRARFTPWLEHDNGLGYLNGGIIATLLDCHSAAAALWEAHQHGWTPLPGAPLSHVTAGLDVRYLRPSPLTQTVDLRAVVTSATEQQISCLVELVWDGKIRATGTARWNRWRPR